MNLNCTGREDAEYGLSIQAINVPVFRALLGAGVSEFSLFGRFLVRLLGREGGELY